MKYYIIQYSNNLHYEIDIPLLHYDQSALKITKENKKYCDNYLFPN